MKERVTRIEAIVGKPMEEAINHQIPLCDQLADTYNEVKALKNLLVSYKVEDEA